jgi:hypothetical protein
VNWHPDPTTEAEIEENARYHAGRGEFTASRMLPPGGGLWPDEGAVMRDYLSVLRKLKEARVLADAVLAWLAHQDEHGCHGSHYPTVDAMREAGRNYRAALSRETTGGGE